VKKIEPECKWKIKPSNSIKRVPTPTISSRQGTFYSHISSVGSNSCNKFHSKVSLTNQTCMCFNYAAMSNSFLDLFGFPECTASHVNCVITSAATGDTLEYYEEDAFLHKHNEVNCCAYLQWSVADTGWFDGGCDVDLQWTQCFTGPNCVNQSLSHKYIYEETSLSVVRSLSDNTGQTLSLHRCGTNNQCG